MIKETIVKQTVEALEDMVDYLDIGDDPEAQKRKGEIQSLLNFWRLYLNFIPEEEDAVC